MSRRIKHFSLVMDIWSISIKLVISEEPDFFPELWLPKLRGGSMGTAFKSNRKPSLVGIYGLTCY